MEILKVAALDGANRFASNPVLEARVDCRGWKPAREGRLRDALTQWLPLLRGDSVQPTRLAGHENATAAASKALERCLQSRGGIGAILQHVTLALQALAGVSATFGEVHETDEPEVWLIAFEYEEAPLAEACLRTAQRLLLAAVDGQAFDVVGEVRKLVDLADDVRLGPSSRAIVNAAVARGIPYHRLNAGSLVQLGEGRHQRRIWTAETDATSAIAESIASDKVLTKRLLRNVGVPVPAGRLVQNAEDAWAAAQEIGLPVVVKPRNANHALGITLNLSTRDQVLAAYDHALKDVKNSDIIVEQYAFGHHHRLLVVGNRMVAAARGESEYVVGNGHQTIQQLVDEVNRDPRRGENYTDLLDVLSIDEGAMIELERQGLKPDSIPEAGRRVLVQQIGDLTTDCTQAVHPRTAEQAVIAAKVIGLDIAGLDVVTQDIAEPLESQRGMILEVNAGPSLGMHIAPLHGQPQPVGEAIVDLMFPCNAATKVPIIGVTGSRERPRLVHSIARLLSDPKCTVGAASSDGRYLGDLRIGSDLGTGRENFASLLIHPQVDAIVFEGPPEEAAIHGSGCRRCDVVVIAPPSRPLESTCCDHALFGQLAMTRAIPPTGTLVVHQRDPIAERLIPVCRGRVLRYDDECSTIRASNEPAGPSVFLRDKAIILASGSEESAVPITNVGSAASVIAAVATMWALGVSAENLARMMHLKL